MLDGFVQICMCTVHLFTGIIAISYNVVDRNHEFMIKYAMCIILYIILIVLAIIGKNTVINSIIILPGSS